MVRWVASSIVSCACLAVGIQAEGSYRSDRVAAKDPRDVEREFIARRESRVKALTPAPDVPVLPAKVREQWGDHPIDAFIGARLEAGTPPPGLCDDHTFVRRAYLDLIGVVPTVEEMRRFVAAAEPDKRARLVDELLARTADYADHWLPFWEDALVSSRAGVTGGMASHGDYSGWIHEAFVSNRPFDLFAAELLDPSLPRHKKATFGSDNGAPRRVHIVLNESHEATLQTAATIAQVFMGTAMKCASCHNHFENKEWPQRRFTAFAGLFAADDLEIIRCESRTGERVKAAFPFEIDGVRGTDAKAAPAGADSTTVEGPVDAKARLESRLHEAAMHLTDPHNPRFARSIVNRLWKRYLGLGLFEPVDDYRESVPASHPELLDWLAGDFMRHGFDLKHTIRLIMSSRTYQARFDAAQADHFDIEHPGAARLFRSPQLRRLTAEQFVDSISVAMNQRLDAKDRVCRADASSALRRALGKPAVRNDVSTGRADDTAVVTGLELLNGEEFQRLVSRGELIDGVLAEPDAEAAARLLFAAVLSREPTREEMKIASEAKGRGREGVEDLLWSMFIDPEFAYVR